jgi:serine kinase of HPr protein (carbohydrate metabolism regulator)
VSAGKTQLLHATCLLIDGSGVLLTGAAGSGKSDLALRLIDEAGALTVMGADPIGNDNRLVADDRVELWRDDKGRLFGRAPDALAGRLEVRGLGIVEVPYADQAEITLAVELVPVEAIDRLPDPVIGQTTIAGAALPRIRLAAFEASAIAKLRLAVRLLREAHEVDGEWHVDSA